jgi:hypothetical protein
LYLASHPVLQSRIKALDHQRDSSWKGPVAPLKSCPKADVGHPTAYSTGPLRQATADPSRSEAENPDRLAWLAIRHLPNFFNETQ